MINPTNLDIGRHVIYYEIINNKRIQSDYGCITSFNDEYVFVLYKLKTTSQATRREDLDWAFSVIGES